MQPNTTHRDPSTRLPLAVGMGLVAGLALGYRTAARRQSRGPVPDADKQAALAAYLHEHLSGADIAIRVVERLSRAETDDQPLFEWLYHEFQGDHRIVRAILDTLGVSSASPKRLLARAPATVLARIAGGNEGDLSLFRTLEALAIGVQGKRCMWRALQSVRPSLRVPGHRSLADLEAAAVRQWEVIEQRRTAVVPETFSTSESA